MDQSSTRRKRIAILAVIVPVVVGLIIVALGRILGNEESETQVKKPRETTEPVRETAPEPAAAGTPAPRVRLTEGGTGKPFDSASLGNAPLAIVFTSPKCGPIGSYLGRVEAEMSKEGDAGAVLAIASDPEGNAPQAVDAWLAKSGLKGGSSFRYLVGEEEELRGYWNAWGFKGPSAACPAGVPAHLVDGSGENAGILDLDPGGAPSLLTAAFAGMSE